MSASPAPLAPYRVLFPLGVAFAIAGAAPWIFAATGSSGDPAVLHGSLMMQGFETSFVLGFLLTSIPAFTHGRPCGPWELAGAAARCVLGATRLPPEEFLFVGVGLMLGVAGGVLQLGMASGPWQKPAPHERVPGGAPVEPPRNPFARTPTPIGHRGFLACHEFV